jgi:hypothetical protein
MCEDKHVLMGERSRSLSIILHLCYEIQPISQKMSRKLKMHNWDVQITALALKYMIMAMNLKALLCSEFWRYFFKVIKKISAQAPSILQRQKTKHLEHQSGEYPRSIPVRQCKQRFQYKNLWGRRTNSSDM